ncbi:prolyl-tRNA synthetase associated domain-containing protein 1-like [Clavelina lepadiformis]|uniref:prolyl-tRNA synthetase associated domain-containing protein 1-like n=1 Tax=Clavelina lepadiformis TaxID=159417 RepID=UPI00404282D4
MDEKRKGLMELLEKLQIKTELIEHEEVFTVEAMMPYLNHCKGVVCKNLFVKDKKKKRLWLIVAKHDRSINLSDIAKKVGGSGGFRFADEQILLEKLCVSQGCVTPLAVFCDQNSDVKVVLDSVFTSDPTEMVYCHPMVNSATIGMLSSDFMKFLKHTNHEPIIVNLVDE